MLAWCVRGRNDLGIWEPALRKLVAGGRASAKGVATASRRLGKWMLTRFRLHFGDRQWTCVMDDWDDPEYPGLSQAELAARSVC